MNKVKTAVGLMLLGATVVGGCEFDSTEDVPGSLDAGELDPEETVFTLTKVELREGQEPLVTVESITLAEQLELKQLDEEGGLGKARSAISRDVYCASTSLQIYDSTWMLGNSICFSGTGEANLASYCRIRQGIYCSDYWDGNVESFETGDTWVQFQDDSLHGVCGSGCSQRAANLGVHDASSCEDDASTKWVERGLCNPG